MTKEEIAQRIATLNQQIAALKEEASAIRDGTFADSDDQVKGMTNLVAVYVGDKRLPFMEDIYAQAYVRCFKRYDAHNTPVTISTIETDDQSELYAAALYNTLLWSVDI